MPLCTNNSYYFDGTSFPLMYNDVLLFVRATAAFCIF